MSAHGMTAGLEIMPWMGPVMVETRLSLDY